MAKYAVTFRFEYAVAGGSTYDERYSSFMAQLRKTGTWEETTSFALTTSTEGLEQFADRLYLESLFNANYDTMLVINIETGWAVSRGKIDYPSILAGKLVKLIQK